MTARQNKFNRQPLRKNINPCDPEDVGEALSRIGDNDRDHEQRIRDIERGESGAGITVIGNLDGDLTSGGTQSFTSLDGEDFDEVYGTLIPTGFKLVAADVVEIGRIRVADGIVWAAVGFKGLCLTNA